MVMGDVQRFIFRFHPAESWRETGMFGVLIRAVDPAQRTAAQIAPWQIFAEIAALTGAELFQIVRRPHPANVKEIFILADA